MNQFFVLDCYGDGDPGGPTSVPIHDRLLGPWNRELRTMASSSSEPSDELATAVGRYVLGDLSLGRAAEAAGLSRWEFEEVLENAGFASLYGPRTDDQLQGEIDVALDRDE
jgi:predicted HTH domain antitoxin